MFLPHPADGAQPVAQASRLFKIESLRGDLHLRADFGFEYLRVSLHKGAHLIQQVGVSSFVNSRFSGPAATFDVVVETYPAATKDFVTAGAEREDGPQRLDR